MTRGTPKSRQAPRPPQAPPEPPLADPLADLREPEDALPEILTETDGDATHPEPAMEPVRNLVTQDRWDEARREAVVAMHADTTTLGFLHKGGNCGCHYIAGVILQAVMPVEPEAEALEV